MTYVLLMLIYMSAKPVTISGEYNSEAACIKQAQSFERKIAVQNFAATVIYSCEPKG